MGFVQEFKEFAMKGNVVDMAVGIIIGVAFGKVTTSLVNDVIMPPIGMLLGKVDFTGLQIVMKAAEVNADGVETAAAVAIRYGQFISTTIDFLVVAFSVFLVVKVMNRMIRAREKEAK